MAQVTITLIDAEKGVLIKVNCDEPMPSPKEMGTIAQNMALIALQNIKDEFHSITGREVQEISIN